MSSEKDSQNLTDKQRFFLEELAALSRSVLNREGQRAGLERVRPQRIVGGRILYEDVDPL